ncbi:hypothetical protein [Nostoc linckia]|uniref:hypothetical protein n=1 Tax=Nostoc linckia TaxID=92942 RepID=UPI0015D51C7A|nr:hypothetical protein [Nostoc linckia]
MNNTISQNTQFFPPAPYFSARGCANGYAQYKCPMPNAPCPMPNAPCPLPPTPCPMPHILCPTWRQNG